MTINYKNVLINAQLNCDVAVETHCNSACTRNSEGTTLLPVPIVNIMLQHWRIQTCLIAAALTPGRRHYCHLVLVKHHHYVQLRVYFYSTW